MGALVEWMGELQGGALTLVSATTTFVFGIFAIILGALFNSYLNRKRDNRLRELEALSTTAALYGEILLLRPQVARIANLVATAYFDEGFSPRPNVKFDEYLLERSVLSHPTIYLALSNKLGILKPDLILAITKFHADCQEVRDWLPKLLPDEKRGYTYSVLHLLDPAYDAVMGVVPTLRKIENSLSIVAADDPPMKKAISARRYEQQTWENQGE
ncbi:MULTISPECIES: hypothetical protein [Devosia]|uniref:hypothetical protein n=1 Tax=Devosia TaxID=46913 RepID=UPI000CE95B5C|nr:MULTISPECIES: hypothetical protein [Devosia]AVF02747.1 hypothetical protein C4375_02705 [Devosia sp. I507]